VEWNAGSTNQEWDVYDATGTRVLTRSINNNGTTLMVYAFGREEHQYSGTGTNQWNTYYYFLGSRLIGDLDANGTFYLLTDALGSILSDVSWSAGGASIKASQVFGPYGNARGSQGTFNTAKGFTGQYNDPLTGLDYYVSRYYDPVVGVFLSADKKQGNLQGMDPYTYVGGNPESRNDPTGQMIEGQNNEYGTIDSQGNLHIWVQYPSYGSGQGYIYRTYYYTHAQLQQPAQDTSGPSSWQKLMDALGITDIQNTFTDPNATFWDKLGAIGGALFNDANNLLLAAMILGDPEGDAVLGGGEALGSSIERVFFNTMPERLADELANVSKLGIEPLRVGDSGFQEMIQNGPVKWAVTLDHELSFIPKFVDGIEIPHTVITKGEPVLAAGEAIIDNSGNGFIARSFISWSGHYLPDETVSDIIGRAAFIEAGINFPPPILGLW